MADRCRGEKITCIYRFEMGRKERGAPSGKGIDEVEGNPFQRIAEDDTTKSLCQLKTVDHGVAMSMGNLKVNKKALAGRSSYSCCSGRLNPLRPLHDR
jgi:hypothetical protein